MLAIDVGNTQITCAVIEGDEVRRVRRIETSSCMDRGAFFGHLDLPKASLDGGIVLCSVRKPVTAIIAEECRSLLNCPPLLVTNDTPMGITNRYLSPVTLGTDRLVDAAACHHLYSKGERPGIIIDMGTATTIDYITEEGEYLGGAIAPGLLSAYRGLLAAAPELPGIDISCPGSLIGKTTADCIRTGVIAGHAALISSFPAMMAKERGSDPVVVVTGGLSGVIRPLLPEGYVWDEHLMLRGLGIVYHINMKNC